MWLVTPMLSSFPVMKVVVFVVKSHVKNWFVIHFHRWKKVGCRDRPCIMAQTGPKSFCWQAQVAWIAAMQRSRTCVSLIHHDTIGIRWVFGRRGNNRKVFQGGRFTSSSTKQVTHGDQHRMMGTWVTSVDPNSAATQCWLRMPWSSAAAGPYRVELDWCRGLWLSWFGVGCDFNVVVPDFILGRSHNELGSNLSWLEWSLGDPN